MGGGTPSLFSAEALDKLFSALRSRLVFAPDIEITLEANPGTVEQGRFKEYRSIGINRLSIGIQSFDDRQLKTLGRIHNANEAIHAAETAHQSGFDNFNLDLMFGLPEQQPSQAVRDLQQAIDLNPSHISWYQLTIEPNTLFYSQPPVVPDDDQLWEIYQQGQARLAEAGYTQYEVSAYAKDKMQCSHNLNYWQFGDYIGIGAGAHGKISNAAEQSIVRRRKTKQPADYIERAYTHTQLSHEQTLLADDISLEFMMNSLRLNNGFATEIFSQHTGLSLNVISNQLDQALEKGWLDMTTTHIKPTEQGCYFLNDLLGLFMPEN
jgi:oxygen-independent coproporphyrinogen-3 oxidase